MTNILAFPRRPSPHAIAAAQRVTKSIDELEAVAAQVESIVADIRKIVAAHDFDRERVLERIDALFGPRERT